MTRLLIASATLALTLFAAGPAAAAFDVTYEEGTRDDVRAWCSVEDGVLSDREDYTMCISSIVPGTTFTCDDAGDCTRTGFDLLATGSVGAARQSVAPADQRDFVTTDVGFPEPHYTPYLYGTNGNNDGK